MKRFLKKPTKALLHGVARGSGLDERINLLEHRFATLATTAQRSLSLQFRDQLARGGPRQTFDEVEFRVHSQNGEDGILLYLFSLLGTPTRRSVELGAGNGIECNTANLLVHHGWRGLLVDGDEANMATAQDFYWSHPDTSWYPPVIVPSFITAENVNDLVTTNGFDGEIDLLSIDLDGVDYWIWKALDRVHPLVVVAEFNWVWGPHEAMTVPYDPAFAIGPRSPNGDHLYHGASLAAMTKLASEKGYRLVGCQRRGVNAFFVRDGIGEELFPAVTPSQCYETPTTRMVWPSAYFDLIRDREWVAV